MKMPQKLLTSVVLIFILTLGFIRKAHSQTAPALTNQGSANQAPSIITNSDEVALSLVVRDKKNKPVLDLKPGDIAVTDSGSPVKISDLRLVTGTSNAEHLVTLVFDQLEPSAGKNGRDIASKILKMASANVPFSVLRIDGRLRLLQQFTSDRDSLTKAIASATDTGRTGPDKSPSGNAADLPEKNLIAEVQNGVDSSGASLGIKQRSDARVILAALEESQRIVLDQHTSPSLASLMALARTQRQVKGRKIVIYFVQGMKLDSNGKDMLRAVIGAANQGGVSIYAIDTNGIDPEAAQGMVATMAAGGVITNNHLNPTPANDPDYAKQFGAATRSAIPSPPPGGVRMGNEQLNRMENEGLQDYKNPLVQLSVSTGGFCISAADSLKKPLQRLVEDITTYYEAFYVPSIENYDGQFRPIAVTPLRAGLKIHSTAGYFALPPGTSSAVRPFEAPLLKLLSQQQLPADLQFRSSVIRMGDLPDGNANSVVVETPISELDVREDANTHLYSLHVSIVAQIKDKNGNIIQHFSEDVPRHGALETLEDARSEAVTMQRHFLLDPGEYVLEAAVLDRNSGKLAAQRTAFQIPAVSPGPSLSDITLVGRTYPSNPETDPLEPLRYENGKIVPNLSGSISPKTKNVSFFFMIHPDARASDQPKLEMEVLRNGEAIGEMPLPLRKTSGQAPIPYMASVQTASLPAGHYDVTATLSQGDKNDTRTVSFTVEGAKLAAMPAKVTDAAENDEKDDIEMASVSNLPTAGILSHPGGRLIITQTTNPVPPPQAEQFQAILAGVRERALNYSVSLPNFTCVEMTDRSVDASSNGLWRHKDTFAELLRFRDNNETRTMLQVNGQRSSAPRSDLNGPLSQGEFGSVLSAVFSPSSKADFQWKEADVLGTGMVHVLSYRVARENSAFELGDSNQRVSVGFHGLVYVDGATQGVRRITLVADDLPRNLAFHSTTITVDYDYIAIGSHDYLMPIHATVSVTEGRRKSVLNEIEFRNYRRYASQAKITYGGEIRR